MLRHTSEMNGYRIVAGPMYAGSTASTMAAKFLKQSGTLN